MHVFAHPRCNKTPLRGDCRGNVLDVVETVTSILARAVSIDCCAACDARLPRYAVFCASCAVSVVDAEGVRCGVPVHAGALYGGAIATALNRLKHRDRPDLARPLAHVVMQRAPRPDADVLVPVPLHPRRLAERGYNQSALLATELGKILSLPVRFDVLARTEPTPPQQGLDRAARQRNVAGKLERTGEVSGLRVLLVDDVCTTGATLSACAAVLREGGASGVAARVVALRALT